MKRCIFTRILATLSCSCFCLLFLSSRKVILFLFRKNSNVNCKIQLIKFNCTPGLIMWYEALPSLLLTGVFVCLPFASLPFIHKFAHHGNVRSLNLTIFIVFVSNIYSQTHFTLSLMQGCRIWCMKGVKSYEMVVWAMLATLIWWRYSSFNLS